MTGRYIGLLNAAPGPLDLTAEAFGFAPLDSVRADEAASRADLIAELAASERENATLRGALSVAEIRVAELAGFLECLLLQHDEGTRRLTALDAHMARHLLSKEPA